MRWFKHMTATVNDEKIMNLLDIGGMEAYGFYWRLIEIIATQIEKDSTICTVTLSLPSLCRQCYLHHNKVSNLLDKIGVTGLMSVRRIKDDAGVRFSITCRNLLKYRDEWTVRKTKTPERLPRNSRETPERTELEAELEAELETETELEAEEAEIYPSPEKAMNIHAELLKALDKVIVSPKEIMIAEKLIEAGCIFEDIAAARKEKGKNQLAYLQNIVCEMRDKRIKKQEDETDYDSLPV